MKLDLKELIAKLTNTPMIVEQGTSDIWTYRKWSNGTAECWGTWAGTLTHYANPFSGFYGYYNTISFPVGLFNSPPNATYTAGVGSAFAWAGAYFGTTTTGMNCYAVAGLSGSQTVRFSISVKGRWK